ncbi:MAG: aryl-sulfate sulfotransferase [Candidatus Thorarchaeota archaeon]
MNDSSSEANVDIDFDDISFNITKKGGYFDALNLFILQKANQSDYADRNATILLLDMNGYVIKELVSPGSRWAFAYAINSSTILLGLFDTNIYFWNIYDDSLTKYEMGWYHHDMSYNPISNTILSIYNMDVDVNSTVYHTDVLREKELNGNIVWEYDTFNSIVYPSMWNGFEFVGGTADVSHTNTVYWDVEEDVIYVNMRNINTFYKINRTTSEVIWGLGEYGDFTLYDLSGNRKTNLFYHAHAVEPLDKNTFILFDNDVYNDTNPNNRKSRILELKIDESEMTANVSWSWVAPSDYYSSYWGDADRLPNGNRLGVFGTVTHPSTSIGARLCEINNEGDIVWEMNFPNDEDYNYGVYKMERLGLHPFITTESYFVNSSTQDVIVSWDVYYNFRSKWKTYGSYQLLVDQRKIEDSNIGFSKYWAPTKITSDLGVLEPGHHNITILVLDETGLNGVSSSIFIEINGTSNKSVLLDLFPILIVGSASITGVTIIVYLKKHNELE